MGTAQPDDRRLERLRWQARRGLLENDLLLKKFLEVELVKLGNIELSTLDQLLQLGDNDLLDLLMGRTPCEDAAMAAMVARIQAA